MINSDKISLIVRRCQAVIFEIPNSISVHQQHTRSYFMATHLWRPIKKKSCSFLPIARLAVLLASVLVAKNNLYLCAIGFINEVQAYNQPGTDPKSQVRKFGSPHPTGTSASRWNNDSANSFCGYRFLNSYLRNVICFHLVLHITSHNRKVINLLLGYFFFYKKLLYIFFFLDLHFRDVNIQKKPPTLHREHSAFVIEFLPSWLWIHEARWIRIQCRSTRVLWTKFLKRARFSFILIPVTNYCNLAAEMKQFPAVGYLGSIRDYRHQRSIALPGLPGNLKIK